MARVRIERRARDAVESTRRRRGGGASEVRAEGGPEGRSHHAARPVERDHALRGWRPLRGAGAAYGVLGIVSCAAGWTWTVERAERWFSRPGADTGTAATLVKAIEAGLARAMGLLGEACSVRDSRRRAAVDAGFAVEHPIRAAKEGKDPTERLAGAKRPTVEPVTAGARAKRK